MVGRVLVELIDSGVLYLFYRCVYVGWEAEKCYLIATQSLSSCMLLAYLCVASLAEKGEEPSWSLYFLA